jgi:hypothetical protein
VIAEEAAPGPVNLRGNGDQFFKNAAKRADIDPNGSFDVIAHGSAQNIEVMTAKGPVTVDQRVAGRLIESSPGYTTGQPVRLLSCDAGACDAGFAQTLPTKWGYRCRLLLNWCGHMGMGTWLWLLARQ